MRTLVLATAILELTTTMPFPSHFYVAQIGSANPKELSQKCTPATYTETVHCQSVLLGVSIPVSDHQRLLDLPFGEGRQASRQLSDASTPW